MILKNLNDILDKFGKECLRNSCNSPPADGRLYCDKHKNNNKKPQKTKSLCFGCRYDDHQDCWHYDDAVIVKKKIRHKEFPIVYRVYWLLDCYKSKKHKEINKL